MTKKASANKFLSFAFENSLYYKRRKRRIHCMSLVVLFFTYNTHLGNKKQKTLQQKNIIRWNSFIKNNAQKSIYFDFLASFSWLWRFESCLKPSYLELGIHTWFKVEMYTLIKHPHIEWSWNLNYASAW